ncbi:MAG: hypothetical protein AB1765_12275 [Candidatus Hydrogenedentota bacterium]
MPVQGINQETGIMDAVINVQKSPVLTPGVLSRPIPERTSFIEKVIADTLQERGIGSTISVQG